MITKEYFKISVCEMVQINPDKISFKDNVRDIGIDSLYLFTIIENLEKEYHISLDLEEMMQMNTLDEFYTMVTKAIHNGKEE